MTIFRLQVVLALALVGWLDASAGAQDLPVATRGTVKVRSRVFNPFETGQSRLTINPFGVIALSKSDPSPLATPTARTPTAPAPATATPAVAAPVVAAPAAAPASSAELTSAVASGAATGSGLPPVFDPVDQPPSGGDEPAILSFVVRPPYRPPTRSPWRPPPRPPFLPP